MTAEEGCAVGREPNVDITPLCDELREHVGMNGDLTVLHHPLVVQVPYLDAGILNRMLNEQLARKKEAVAEALLEGDGDRYVLLNERAYRLEALCKIIPAAELSPRDFWRLLALVWIDAEDPDQYSSIYEGLFTFDRIRGWGDRHYLMEDFEREAFDRLPEVMTVYRGANHDTRKGLSWTLSRNVAYFFATRWGARDRIYRMQIDKSDVIAYFTRRGEAELILHPDAWTEPELDCDTSRLTKKQRRAFKKPAVEKVINAGAVMFYGDLNSRLEPADHESKVKCLSVRVRKEAA